MCLNISVRELEILWVETYLQRLRKAKLTANLCLQIIMYHPYYYSTLDLIFS